MTDDNMTEGRFSRWSRRKRSAAKGESVAADAATELALEAEEDALEIETVSPERQAELLANREAAEAVDLEQMNENSDFSVFLKDGVPDLLKKKAMTALWKSDPVLANVDGLVDYGDDFASPDLVMKKFASAYQIGKGYFFPDEAEESEEEILAELDKGELTEQTADEADNTDEREISEDTVEDGPINADLVVEKETEVQVATADPVGEPIEEVPAPKVSLRKRLQLDI